MLQVNGFFKLLATRLVCKFSLNLGEGRPGGGGVGGTPYSRRAGVLVMFLGVQIGDLGFSGIFLGKSEEYKISGILRVIQAQI